MEGRALAAHPAQEPNEAPRAQEPNEALAGGAPDAGSSAPDARAMDAAGGSDAFYADGLEAAAAETKAMEETGTPP